jgi:hypothetical protein
MQTFFRCKHNKNFVKSMHEDKYTYQTTKMKFNLDVNKLHRYETT